MSALDEKLALLKSLQAEIEAIRYQEKAEAMNEISALIAKYDIKLGEAKHLFSDGHRYAATSANESASAVAPRRRARSASRYHYVNPADTAQIYRGKGPRPSWLAAMSDEEREACKVLVSE